jgi:hypothetical protein
VDAAHKQFELALADEPLKTTSIKGLQEKPRAFEAYLDFIGEQTAPSPIGGCICKNGGGIYPWRFKEIIDYPEQLFGTDVLEHLLLLLFEIWRRDCKLAGTRW